MQVEVYVLEDKDGNEVGGPYGPYGYASQGEALEDAKRGAWRRHARVVAYQFEFTDSELVDDFTEEAAARRRHPRA